MKHTQKTCDTRKIKANESSNLKNKNVQKYDHIDAIRTVDYEEQNERD